MFDNIPLFTGLGKQDLDTIAQHTVARTFSDNTVLLREGEVSDSLYFILYGKV